MNPERNAGIIESVRFEPANWNPPGTVQVIAGLDDGTELELFRYYSDELRFSAEELIGRSVAEARALHHQRDRKYLDS